VDKRFAPEALAGALEGQGRASFAGRAPNTTPSTQGQQLSRLRRQRQVEQLCHVLRLVFELLDELGRHHGIAEDIDRRLARYAGLDPEFLRALGGDRFPGTPIHLVPASKS